MTLEQACESYDGLQAPEGFRANLVTDLGKVDDGTFNQFAYEGMVAAVECFGIENTSFIETVSRGRLRGEHRDIARGEPQRARHRRVPDDDRHRGRGDGEPRRRLHRHRPVPRRSTRPTWPASSFNEDESGYIAGVLAASLSESGVIGVVAGREDVPPVVKFVNGYTAGAQSVNPDIRVLSIYNESFTEPAKGASDAAQFIGEGADVIFGAGGPTGSGGVEAAAEAGVWAIGVDQDEYFTTFAGGTAPGSEFLASSAIKRVDLVTFRLIADSVQDTFEGGLFVGTAANDLITYAEAHDADLPAEAVAAVEAARVGLADGSDRRRASVASTGCCSVKGRPATQSADSTPADTAPADSAPADTEAD